MNSEIERRSEQRIRFNWPVWFGYEENGEFFQGQIVDLNRQGMSFVVDSNRCPQIGSHIIARFSYPLTQDGGFQMGRFFQWAKVIRSDTQAGQSPRVALRLNRPIAEFVKQDQNDCALQPA